jgi:hypothetical protein
MAFDSQTKEQRLTKPQLDALERLLRGPENWRGGSNAGGATGRMLKGLMVHGFLRGPPYYVTDQGRAALAVKNDIVARLKDTLRYGRPSVGEAADLRDAIKEIQKFRRWAREVEALPARKKCLRCGAGPEWQS